jgi:hypothetical protein
MISYANATVSGFEKREKKNPLVPSHVKLDQSTGEYLKTKK